MRYSINQAAARYGITEHTIRYYDKEGLLPFLKRSESGMRSFSENDMEWLQLICCLKNTGMQIKQIKQYIDWCVQGNETVEIRRQMFIKHREDVLNQIAELQKYLETINYKIKYYDERCCTVPVLRETGDEE
ncbi:MAG: MerR family transcriptional regulator [Ignavibacteriales bacterium]